MLKLNTDTTNLAGYGEVLRDSAVEWVLGFYGKATGTSSLEIEVWGFTVIFEKGLSNVILESDSKCGSQLLQQEA